MTTLKKIIGQEYKRMLKAGIADASREEALGYLIWQHFRSKRWKLFRVIYWILRYADYHQEAVDIEDLGNRRISAECASLHWAERRKRFES